MMSPFEQELSGLLNRYSAENGSHTPDFILAQYLKGCLDVFDEAVKARSKWYEPPWPASQETSNGT